MCQSNKKEPNYETLADLARIVGVHRTTILDWIKRGKIKSRKGKNAPKNQRHRLSPKLLSNHKKINELKKPYPKYSNTWGGEEIYMLQHWSGTDEQLAKAIGRTVNAIRIKRCRLNDV